MLGLVTRNCFAAVCAAVLILSAAGGLKAAPITFSLSGTGSGSVGGTNFGGAAFTITATGDTNNFIDGPTITIPSFGQVTFSDASLFLHSSASIWIEGAGHFNFISETATFFNNASTLPPFNLPLPPLLGFQAIVRDPADPANVFDAPDLLNLPLNGAIDRLDPTNNPPQAGTGEFLQWDSTAVLVENLLGGGGPLDLVFNDGPTELTFDAEFSVIPLPAALPFMLSGIAFFGLLGWRKRRHGSA